jgi:hypothetical protein
MHQGKWLSASRSTTGTSHKSSGLPCQDACGTAQKGNKTILAIADGAGSAKNAELGASIAVREILDAISQCTKPCKEITEDDCSIWLAKIIEAIQREADKSNSEIGDYATTLLFAIFEEDGALFWQLGDGGWVYDNGDKIEAATWPQNGEYIDQTYFITSPKAEDMWKFVYCDNVKAAIGFTDGIEFLCLDFSLKEPVYQFTGKILSYLKLSNSEKEVGEQIQMLLDSPSVEERTDDDKTLAAAWRPERDDTF